MGGQLLGSSSPQVSPGGQDCTGSPDASDVASTALAIDDGGAFYVNVWLEGGTASVYYSSSTYHGDAVEITSAPPGANWQAWFYAQDLPATSGLTVETNATGTTALGMAVQILNPSTGGDVVSYDAGGAGVSGTKTQVVASATTTQPSDWDGMGFADNDGSGDATVGTGESVLSDCNVPSQGIYLGVVARSSPVDFAGGVSLSVNISNYGAGQTSGFTEGASLPSTDQLCTGVASATSESAGTLSIPAGGAVYANVWASTGSATLAYVGGTFHGAATSITSANTGTWEGWFYADDLPSTPALTLVANATSSAAIGIAAMVISPSAPSNVVYYDSSGAPGSVTQTQVTSEDYTFQEPTWVGMGFFDLDGAADASVGLGEAVVADCNIPGQAAYLGLVERVSPVGFAGGVDVTTNVTLEGDGIASGFYQSSTGPLLTLPSFTASPSSLDLGQSMTFTVSASGGMSPYSYAWNGLPSGCTNSSTTSITCTPTTTGSSSVVVDVRDSTGDQVSSAPAAVTVYPDPTVSITPSGGTVGIDVGQTGFYLSLILFDPGPGDITVDWYSSNQGSVCIPSSSLGAGLTYTPSNSVPAVSYYCAQLTDADLPGYVSSSGVETVVVTADPTVSISPSGGTLNYDVGEIPTALTATVTYSGPNTATTNWYTSSNSGTCTTVSLLATGASYTPGTTSAGSTAYCAEVQDSGQGLSGYTSFSGVETVAVHADPTVSVSPSGPLTYDRGQSAATLTATRVYSGLNVAPIWWYSSSTATCDDASTNLTVSGPTFTPSTASLGTTYYCSVVSDNGIIAYAFASNAVKVVVNNVLTAGAITPGSPSLDDGQSVTLDSSTAGGTPSYSYQWYSSTTGFGPCDQGSPLVGMTASMYATGAITSSTYFCDEVKDSTTGVAGANGSAWDLVSVFPALVAGAIAAAPLTVDYGQTVTLLPAPAGGTGVYSYGWYSAAFDTGPCVSGTIVSTASVFTSGPMGGNTYFCYHLTDTSIGSPLASANSTWLLVSVEPALVPGMVLVPSSAIDVGQSTTLEASAASEGTAPYTDVWRAGPSPTCADDAATGQSALSYVVSPVATTYYCVQYSDASAGAPAAVVYSDVVQLTVDPDVMAGAVSPSSVAIDLGQSVTLTENTPTGGTSPYTYQWRSGSSTTCTSDSVITGATSSTYVAVPASNIYYCVQVGDSSGGTPGITAYSGGVEVLVDPPLSATVLTPEGPSIDLGQSLELTAEEGGGSAPLSFQWFSSFTGSGPCDAGTMLVGATGPKYIPPSIGTDTDFCYQVTDSSDGGVEVADSPWDAVTVNPVLSAGGVTPASPSVLSGHPVVLSVHESGGTPLFTFQWYSSTTGTGACNSGTEIGGANNSTYTAEPGSNTYYCYQVTDSSAGGAESVGSHWDLVSVTSSNTGLSVSSVLDVSVIVILLLIVVIVLLLLTRGRRPSDPSRRGPPRSPPEGPPLMGPVMGPRPRGFGNEWDETAPVGMVAVAGPAAVPPAGMPEAGPPPDLGAEVAPGQPPASEMPPEPAPDYLETEPAEPAARPDPGSAPTSAYALPYSRTPSRRIVAPPLSLGEGVRIQGAQRIGAERGTVEEQSPFQGLRPEDVNPQLRGQRPLPKSVLQPMEMRITQDRGTDPRESTEPLGPDPTARDVMDAARKARSAPRSKMGVEQAAKPPEEEP